MTFDDRDTRDTRYPRYDSIYVGSVVAINDPLSLCRVRVRIPGLIDESRWAMPIGLSLGEQAGDWAIPEVGSNVVVWFLQGSVDHPYYAYGPHAAPSGQSEAPSEANKSPLLRVLKFGGQTLTFDASSDLMRLKTASEYEIVIDETNKKISLTTPTGKEISVSDSTNQAIVKTQSQSITINEAGQSIDIVSTAQVNLTAPTTNVVGSLNVAGSAVTMNGTGNIEKQFAGNEQSTIVGTKISNVLGQKEEITIGAYEETIGGYHEYQVGGAVRWDIAGLLSFAIAGVVSLVGAGAVSIMGASVFVGTAAAGAGGLLLGSFVGTKYRLLDERFLPDFNNHYHPIPGGPPNTKIVGPLADNVLTRDTKAS